MLTKLAYYYPGIPLVENLSKSMNYYAPTFVGTAMTLLCGVFDSSGYYFKV